MAVRYLSHRLIWVILLNIFIVLPAASQYYVANSKSPTLVFLNRKQFNLYNPHRDITLQVTIKNRHGISYGDYLIRPGAALPARFSRPVQKDDLENLEFHFQYSQRAYQTDIIPIRNRLSQLGANKIANSVLDAVEFEDGLVDLFKNMLQYSWAVGIEREIRQLKERASHLQAVYRKASSYSGSSKLLASSSNIYVFNRQTPLIEIRASYDIVGATNSSNSEERAEGEKVKFSWEKNRELLPFSGRIALPVLSESLGKSRYGRLYLAAHYQQFATQSNDVAYVSPQFVSNPDTRNAFRLLKPLRIEITALGASLAFKSVAKSAFYELEAGAMQLTSTILLEEDGLEPGFELEATEIDPINKKIGFFMSGTFAVGATPNSLPIGLFASLTYLRTGLSFVEDFGLFQNVAGTAEYQLPQNVWKLNAGVNLAL